MYTILVCFPASRHQKSRDCLHVWPYYVNSLAVRCLSLLRVFLKAGDVVRGVGERLYVAAPEMVAWTAGSIVDEGDTVGNGTWSSRSHWKLRKMMLR